MNLNNARYILEIVKQGTVAKAALNLFISQPALSQTIRKVEIDYGINIFEKVGKKLVLTDFGKLYIKTAKQMLLLDQNLRDKVVEYLNKEDTSIKFGISAQLGITILPKILNVFSVKYPEVKLQTSIRGSTLLEKMVADGDIDIAISTNHYGYENVEYELLQEEIIGLIVGVGSNIYDKYRDGQMIGIEDAKNSIFVFLTTGHNSRTIQDMLFASFNLKPKQLIELDNFEMAKNVAINCKSVMIAPYSLVKYDVDVKASGAHFLPLKNINIKRDNYVIYNKDRYKTRYMRSLIESIKKSWK